MTISTRHCDICGDLITSESKDTNPILLVRELSNPYGFLTLDRFALIDICPSCRVSFLEWVSTRQQIQLQQAGSPEAQPSKTKY